MTSLDDLAAAVRLVRSLPPPIVRLRMSSDVYGQIRERYLADPSDVAVRPIMALTAVPVRVDPTLPPGSIRAEMADGTVRDLSGHAVDPQPAGLVPS